MVAGFTTSHKIRPLLVSKMELYMREKSPIVRSRRLMDELTTFIWKTGRGEAATGYNDDLVMSFGTALWIRDTALRLQQQGMDLSRKTLGHFGKSNPGVYSTGNIDNGSWQWGVGGQNESLTWLI